MRILLTCLLAIVVTPLHAASSSPVPAPLPVTEVAGGVFVSVAPYALATPENADDIANLGFIVGDKAVAVIDTGGSNLVGERLLAAIRAKTDRPIRYIINTHDHPDHLFGNGAFVGTGAPIVGHRRLPDALAARAEVYLDATRRLIGADRLAGTQILPPSLLVTQQMTLDLGGRQLLLEAWPVAHTGTDLTVLDERTGAWFLGDLIFAGHVPALDGSLKGWLKVLETLRSHSARQAVPGHGPAALPWPDALEATQGYLQVLLADTKRLIDEGRTMREAAASAAQTERSKWALFDDFNARNAVAAYHELEW